MRGSHRAMLVWSRLPHPTNGLLHCTTRTAIIQSVEDVRNGRFLSMSPPPSSKRWINPSPHRLGFFLTCSAPPAAVVLHRRRSRSTFPSDLFPVGPYCRRSSQPPLLPAVAPPSRRSTQPPLHPAAAPPSRRSTQPPPAMPCPVSHIALTALARRGYTLRLSVKRKGCTHSPSLRRSQSR